MRCNIFKYCGISNECSHLTAYICQFFIYFLNDSRVRFAKSEISKHSKPLTNIFKYLLSKCVYYSASNGIKTTIISIEIDTKKGTYIK